MRPAPGAAGVALLAALRLGSASAAPDDRVTLSLLATCDIHGHVEGERFNASDGAGHSTAVTRGGLGLLSAYAGNLRHAHPGRVVLIDAGDMLQGTMLSNLGEGQAVVRAMNAVGFAAAAVGNHEFDFGPVGEDDAVRRGATGDPRGALAARAAEARFPLLTANVVGQGGAPPVPGVRPFVILEVDGVRLGVVGGTSEDLFRTTRAVNLVGLHVEPLGPAIVRAAASARAAGATVVVALVHEGAECRGVGGPDDLSACREHSPVFALARSLPPGTVDAIFAGHSHQAVAARVAGIPLLQAWSEARGFSRLDLTIDRATGKVVPGGATIFPPTELCTAVLDGTAGCDPRRARGAALTPARYEGAPVEDDGTVAAAVAADLARIAALRAQPVGVTLAAPLLRSYRAESALGNLAADALRHAAGADIGLTNGGGLRADLPAGPLSQEALFVAFPFGNRLARLTARGAALRRLLAANLRGDRGILSVSGITVSARCERGRLVVEARTDAGEPIVDEGRYAVATSDFLALGGDDFAALGHLGRGQPSTLVIDEDGPVMRDLVAAELRRVGPALAAAPLVVDPASPRIRLPHPRPVRCGPVPPDAAPPPGGAAN